MKKSLPISEEMLNAFIDNELEAEEREYIIELEESNKELKETICEAHRLKMLVKAARTKEPVDVMNNFHNKKQNYNKYYITASFILFLVTAFFSVTNNNDSILKYTSKTNYNDNNSLLIAAKEQKNLNLVLHLQTSGSKQANNLFSTLNSVLKTSERYKNNLQVEVILSGLGLQLLQTNYSTYTHTIRSIGKNNQNVTFIACGKTLKNFQDKLNKNISIIKEAMLVSSGPSWAKKRQQQGWSYLTI